MTPRHSSLGVVERRRLVNSELLARFLYRPVAFLRPERVVNPPSWIEHIPFAFWLTDALRPDRFVELGTHTGNSYAAFAQAVQTLGLDTTCYAVDTWEGDPHSGLYGEEVFEEWARYHDAHFASHSRMVRSTFADAARYFQDETIDLLHIDGYHTYEALSEDLEIWRPKLSCRGVILFHDINVREGDLGAWRVWDEVKHSAPSFEFLHGYGLGVLGVGPDLPDDVRWLLELGPDESAEAVAVRDFFSTLGRAVSADFKVAQAEQLVEERGAEPLAIGERKELERATRDRQWLIEQLYHLRIESRRYRDRTENTLRRARRQAESLDHQLETVRATRWQKIVSAASTFSSTLKAIGLHPGVGLSDLGTAASFVAHPASLRAAYIITKSGLFDETYYRSCYPDVSHQHRKALAHFVLQGAAERRSPHPLFDTAWYCRVYPDVAASPSNPLVHYLLNGAREGRAPHPLFDVEYYTRDITDRRLIDANALIDYVQRGGLFEGRSPHPLFDVDFYLMQNPDVADVDPFIHFLTKGVGDDRDPSSSFDCSAYLARNPDAGSGGMNPLLHFVLRNST